MIRLTQDDINALEHRLNKIQANLPADYTAQIGVILTCNNKYSVSVLDFYGKSTLLADIIINNHGHCVKNRWGQTCY